MGPLTVVALVQAACVAGGFARLLRHRLAAACLDPDPAKSPSFWGDAPLVSILIPARNEEEIIGRCVGAVLAQTYTSFELIICNDDSTDRTGAILDAMALQDPRVQIIHRTGPPPPGWIGKNHALHTAFQSARGDVILTIDADCILERRALAAAVERMVRPTDGVRRDLVSALPHVECPDLANRLMMPVFGIWLGLALPIHEINNPKSKTALAAGGFLMIKREALTAIGGYERIRSHIVEDAITARLVKNSGRRIELFMGRGSVSTQMYSGWADLWEGITKNTFAGADFSVVRALLGAVAILFSAVAPFIVVAIACIQLAASGGALELYIQAAAAGFACVLLFILHAGVHRETGVPWSVIPLAPLGHAVFAAAIVTSTLRGGFGGGVAWKGRKYYGSGVEVPGDSLRG